MITITLHNEETGAYIYGTFDFTFDGNNLEYFLKGMGKNITIGNTFSLTGSVTVTGADSGNRKEEQ
jgi:hypothetical protein